FSGEIFSPDTDKPAGQSSRNPGMMIRYRDIWTPVKDIIDSQGISLNDLKEHALDKHRKELEEWKKRTEKEKKKREREEELRRQSYGWYRNP
ncbi:MAG: hypothetical protein D4R67_00480, partial [Bacteroidetes bacterium]